MYFAPHVARAKIPAAGSVSNTVGFLPSISVRTRRVESEVSKLPSDVQLKLLIFSPAMTSGDAVREVLPSPGRTKRLLAAFCCTVASVLSSADSERAE